MILTNLQDADTAAVLALLNEPAVIDALCRDKLPVVAGDLRTALIGDPHRMLTFALRTEAGKLEGIISLGEIDWISRKTVIGNLAVRNPWHAMRAVYLAGMYAFKQLGMNRIECRVWADNELTPKICRRFGGHLDGTLRQAVYRDGRYFDVEIWSMVRSDWEIRYGAAA